MENKLVKIEMNTNLFCNEKFRFVEKQIEEFHRRK